VQFDCVDRFGTMHEGVAASVCVATMYGESGAACVDCWWMQVELRCGDAW
jgi:hypothetical protein